MDEKLTRARIAVFPPSFLSHRRRHGRQHPALVAYAPRRSQDGDPAARGGGPEGEDCECEADEHAECGRGREQQHDAEYVYALPSMTIAWSLWEEVSREKGEW